MQKSGRQQQVPKARSPRDRHPTTWETLSHSYLRQCMRFSETIHAEIGRVKGERSPCSVGGSYGKRLFIHNCINVRVFLTPCPGAYHAAIGKADPSN